VEVLLLWRDDEAEGGAHRLRNRSHYKQFGEPTGFSTDDHYPAEATLSNVIFMDERKLKGEPRGMSVRDRRYCIRYPLAADAETFDLETGAQAEGVTSDISLGGAFVCTSKPLPSNSRVRITLKRKDEKVEALAVVRIVKPRIGMGIEFIDVEPPYDGVLKRWVEQLSKVR
jgi:PilZ domain